MSHQERRGDGGTIAGTTTYEHEKARADAAQKKLDQLLAERDDAAARDPNAARRRRAARDGQHEFSIRKDVGLKMGLGLYTGPVDETPAEDAGNSDAAKARREARLTGKR